MYSRIERPSPNSVLCARQNLHSSFLLSVLYVEPCYNLLWSRISSVLLSMTLFLWRQVLANERVRRPPPHGLGLVRTAGGAACHLDRDAPQGWRPFRNLVVVAPRFNSEKLPPGVSCWRCCR